MKPRYFRHIAAALSVAMAAAGANASPARVNSNPNPDGSYEVPYIEDFEDAENGAKGLPSLGFTVFDVDGDKVTWKTSFGDMVIEMADGAHDDWAITPGLRLEQGKSYRVSISTKCVLSDPERIEVMAGKAPTVEAMTLRVLEPYVIDWTDGYRTVDMMLTPDADGVWHIGFHCISEPDKFKLFIDEIKVESPVSTGCPGKPSQVTATPDAQGRPQVNISFTAPTESVTGSAVNSLTSATVKCGDRVVGTVTEPVAGQRYSIDDTQAVYGNAVYEVYASNAEGDGPAESVEVKVGLDAPSPVTSVTTSVNADGASLSWPAVTKDVNGRTYAPGLVTYKVVRVIGDEPTLVADDIAETHYTVTVDPQSEQDFYQWAVVASYAGMTSDGAYSDMVAMGKPYTLPFAESFANGAQTYKWIADYPDPEHPALVEMATDETFAEDGLTSSDADNGYVYFMANFEGYSAMIYSARISLENAVSPVLTFKTFGISEKSLNTIAVSVNSGNGFTEAATFVCAAPACWTQFEVDMTPYVGKTVQIAFTGRTRSFSSVTLDDVRLVERPTHNLTLTSIDAPEIVHAGVEALIAAEVTNNGAQGAKDYDVEFYADGAMIASVKGPELASVKSARVECPCTFSAMSPARMTVQAVVRYAADMVATDNNSEQKTVAVRKNSYPAPSGLSARLDGGEVRLDWTAPSLTDNSREVAETFDDCISWTHELEGWSFIDCDLAPVGTTWFDIPGIIDEESTSSFFVFDATNDTDFDTHANSGSNFLASLYVIANDGKVDDWAISPLLSGDAQTISMYACSFSHLYPERMEILYTDKDSDSPEDYTPVAGFTAEEIPTTWTRYEAELPQGARHFAIRNASQNQFMLMVDDICYQAAPARVSLTGYNVYRNGQLLNATPIETTAYTAEAGHASDRFRVTAVYDKGESGPSDYASLDDSGIATPGAGRDLSVSIVGGNIIVSGYTGEISVYDLSGKTVYTGNDSVISGLNAGVYIVRAGNNVAKIII